MTRQRKVTKTPTERRAQRGLRDEAGVGPDPRDAVSLTAMKDLKDYKVAAGEPDIRGWNVFSANGRELGDVDDLLVDKASNEVVMIDIDLKRDDRHSLAPIRAAWIDRALKRVVINSQYLVSDEDIPALNGRTLPADDSVERFNERYARAYGDLGWDRDRAIQIQSGGDQWRITRPLPPPPSELSGIPGALAEQRATEREVRFPRIGIDIKGGEKLVIEEVVMRRRIVDASELDPAEVERLRATSVRDGIERPPPADERR